MVSASYLNVTYYLCDFTAWKCFLSISSISISLSIIFLKYQEGNKVQQIWINEQESVETPIKLHNNALPEAILHHSTFYAANKIFVAPDLLLALLSTHILSLEYETQWNEKNLRLETLYI